MIPLVRPLVPSLDEIKRLLAESYRTGQMTNGGPCYLKAREMLEALTPGKKWIPVSNGTVALEVALGETFWPGARIGVPDFTFSATLLAVLRAKMIPVILPCSPGSMTVDFQHLEANTNLFDGFIVVSPFGYRVATDRYAAWAKALNRPVVFDFAGAFGMDAPTTSPVAYSFHATKNLGIGEGGAVRFAEEQAALGAERMINFGFDSMKIPDVDCMNGKLDEIHCAMICAHLLQIGRLHDRIERKKQVISRYRTELAKIVQWHDLEIGGAPYTAVFGGFSDPAQWIEKARCEGIQLRHAYYPLMSEVPQFRHFPRIARPDPFLSSCLALPSDVDDNEFGRVVDFFRYHSSKKRRSK